MSGGYIVVDEELPKTMRNRGRRVWIEETQQPCFPEPMTPKPKTYGKLLEDPIVNVKAEHVLKSSVSNPGLSTAGENMRPPPTVHFGPRVAPLPLRSTTGFMSAAAVKRPSPTPSIKRHKAEKLLKEHGSPPNVRVTAGGRIVPTDFTPLGSPRYSYAALQRPGPVPPPIQIPENRAFSNPMRPATANLPNGTVAYDEHGNLCQRIDGKWLVVSYLESGNPALYMPPPNWPFPAIHAPVGPGNIPFHHVMGPPTSVYQPPPPMPSQGPQLFSAPAINSVQLEDIDTRIQALRNEYEAVRHSKIDYERLEVKLSERLTPEERLGFVEGKRRFVIDLDAIRKRVKDLEATKISGSGHAGALHLLPPAQNHCAVPVEASNQNQSGNVDNLSPVSEPSPTSRAAPRRSHAIEIKDPRSASCLNPTSPSYEPGKPFPLHEGSPPAFVVPAPSPIDTPNLPTAELAQQYPWIFETDNNDGSRSHSQATVVDERHPHHAPSQHQTSQSSVTTTDFFPTNTHEHSFGKYMIRKASGPTNPLTPPRDMQDNFVSPLSEMHRQTRLSSESPIEVDNRMSSFLRDTAINIAPTKESSPYGQSPIRPELELEFDGKSEIFLEGYVAALGSNAPALPKDADYINGYCYGLQKSLDVRAANSSTASKSGSVSASTNKTPPKTVDNRSSDGPLHHENTRLTQSAACLPSSGSFSQQPSNAPNNHQATSSFPLVQGRGLSQLGSQSHSHYQQTSFLPLDRAISEARTQNKSLSTAERSQHSVWNASPAYLTSRGKEVLDPIAAPIRRERIMSANHISSQSNLTGYAGNRHEIGGVVGPRIAANSQPRFFGDDKYGYSSPTESFDKVGSKSYQARQVVRERSNHSRLDGAMDDLAEMVDAPKLMAGAQQSGSAQKFAIPAATSGDRNIPSNHARFPTNQVSPPASSPAKSSSSPKKLASPKQRVQNLANRFLGGGERSDRARAESPDEDPKKMNPDEKRQWKQDWRAKFQQLKSKEAAEIKKYKKENPL